MFGSYLQGMETAQIKKERKNVIMNKCIVLMKTIDLRVNQVFFFLLHYRTLNFLVIVRVPIVCLQKKKEKKKSLNAQAS